MKRIRLTLTSVLVLSSTLFAELSKAEVTRLNWNPRHSKRIGGTLSIGHSYTLFACIQCMGRRIFAEKEIGTFHNMLPFRMLHTIQESMAHPVRSI
jgi:hypothetical protein